MSFFEDFVNMDVLEQKSVFVTFPAFKKPFEIRQLTALESSKIMSANSKIKRENSSIDIVNIQMQLTVASVVFPDLSKTDVIETAERIYEKRTGKKTKLINKADTLAALLLPGELSELHDVVDNLSKEREEQEEEYTDFRPEVDELT